MRNAIFAVTLCYSNWWSLSLECYLVNSVEKYQLRLVFKAALIFSIVWFLIYSWSIDCIVTNSVTDLDATWLWFVQNINSAKNWSSRLYHNLILLSEASSQSDIVFACFHSQDALCNISCSFYFYSSIFN